MKKKVIIDTDPGVDDAMAISFAWLSPAIDLLAITTVFGNVSVEQSTRNACILLDKLGAAIPVARGAAEPLQKELSDYPDFVHGKNGFGDIKLPTPGRAEVPDSAVDLIVEQVEANPGEIRLVAIGPLTNIATALERCPSLLQKVKELVILGGAFTINGNVNPAAEANMLSDPHAADRVFSQTGPITVIGLDVTQEVVMTDDYLREVHNETTPAGSFLFDMTRLYLDFHRSGGIDGLYTHDPSAIAYVINPGLFGKSKGEVRVLCDGIGMGQTIMNRRGDVYGSTPWSGIPRTDVCLEVRGEELLDLYKNTFIQKS